MTFFESFFVVIDIYDNLKRLVAFIKEFYVKCLPRQMEAEETWRFKLYLRLGLKLIILWVFEIETTVKHFMRDVDIDSERRLLQSFLRENNFPFLFSTLKKEMDATYDKFFKGKQSIHELNDADYPALFFRIQMLYSVILDAMYVCNKELLGRPNVYPLIPRKEFAIHPTSELRGRVLKSRGPKLLFDGLMAIRIPSHVYYDYSCFQLPDQA